MENVDNKLRELLENQVIGLFKKEKELKTKLKKEDNADRAIDIATEINKVKFALTMILTPIELWDNIYKRGEKS